MSDNSSAVSGGNVELHVIGTSGLNAFGGRVYEEWHRGLYGDLAPRNWREMADNDAVVGSALRLLRLLMAQAPWRVVESDPNNARAVDAAKFVDECLDDMGHNWAQFMSEVDTFLEFGWALFEVCYKLRKGPNGDAPSRFNDGRVGWAHFAPRAQETRWKWEIERDGTFAGMWQLAPPLYQLTLIPLAKCLHFRLDPRKNNPEGRSILRNAFIEYTHKKRVQQFEGIGVERDLCGIPDMQVPAHIANPAADDSSAKAVKDSIVAMLSQFRQDQQSFLLRPAETDVDGNPTGYKFSLIGSPGAKQYNTGEIIQRCNKMIALALNAELLMLGMDKVGSYALADSKTNTLGYAVAALLDIKEQVLNQQAIAPLMRLNGFPEECWPRLEHGDVEVPDTKDLASAMQALGAGGFLTPDFATENRVREFMSLPLKPDEGVGGTSDGQNSPAPAEQQHLTAAFQRLMAAKAVAVQAGDTAMAASIDVKLNDLLGRM